MNRPVWRLPLCVAVSAVFASPCYAELTVLPGEIYENYEYLDIETVLNNGGEFTNFAGISLISSYDSVTGVFNQAELINTGAFNNVGYGIGLYQGSVLNNSGTFNSEDLYLGTGSVANNSGEYTNYISVSGDNTGVFNNSGTFNNSAYANISGLDKFNNSGTLNNYGEIDIGDSQVFNNYSSGVINNYSSINVSINGTIDNADHINNFNRVELHGTINNNTGEINNTSEISGSGIINNSRMSVLINEQLITGLSGLNSSGLVTNNGSIQTDNMQVSGLLNGSGDITTTNGLVITEAGTLAPGDWLDSIYNPFAGEIDIYGDLILNGTLEIEFDYYGINDVVNVNGNVALGENSVLDVFFLSDSYVNNWVLGETYDVMFADSITGGFSEFFYYESTEGDLALDWLIIEDFAGRDILRIEVVSAVPLPAAFWLFLSGLVGLISIRRRIK